MHTTTVEISEVSQSSALHAADSGPGARRVCSEEQRQALLDILSGKFNVRILRIVRFTGTPGHYRLETPTGAVQLGGVDGLITQNKLRRSLADVTGRYLSNFKKEDWEPLAQALLDACEEVDRGEDATLEGILTERLDGYLRERTIHPSIEQADPGREPFTHDGRVHIYIDAFRSWLQIRRSERIPRNTLTADLRACEVVPVKLCLLVEGQETSRQVWQLPAGRWDWPLQGAASRK